MNINKNIRGHINSSNESFKKSNGGGYSLLDLDIGPSFMVSYAYNEEGEKTANIFDSLINATGYSDMYTSLILKQKTVGLSAAENKYLEMLRKINSYEELQMMYKVNPQMFSIAIKEMIGFYNSNGYHKILRMKCLSDDDIAQISKINTVFYQDLDEYNIEVTSDYIIGKILKFKNRGKDEEKLLNDAAAFITSMRRINNRQGKMLILKLIENVIKTFSVSQGEYNEAQNGLFNSYKFGLELLLNEMDFDDVKDLLEISIKYTLNKEKYESVPLNDENQKLLDQIKKYGLGMDEDV